MNAMKVWNQFDKAREKRWAKQRASRGFSDRDLWSFDIYLAEVIVGGLREIKKAPGYPGDMSHEKWEKILNRIIEGFELLADTEKPYYMRSEEEKKKIKKAKKLFGEYFECFWT